jgi:polyisoprenoid-binding protein YceI
VKTARCFKRRYVAGFAALSLAGAAWPEGALYQIDPTHASVTFEVSHLGLSTLRGRFARVEGTVMLDKAGRSARAEITLDTASLSTGAATLDAQLKAANFLNVAEFTSASFKADNFSFKDQNIVAVEGALTLRGKTLPVVLRATRFNCYFNLLFQREVCGGDFETTLERSRWGVGQAESLGLADSVRLLIQVEAIKQ